MASVYQYYVVEIQCNAAGEYSHDVHYVWDADPDVARRKGEAKFYDVLSRAALSNLAVHSAILFSTEGVPIDHRCYKKDITPTPEPEPEPETNTEGE